MKKLVVLAATVALLVLGGLAFTSNAEAARPGGAPGPGFGSQRPTVTPQGTPRPLSEAEITALQTSLDSEYKAWAMYDQVVTDFGQIQPFVQIRNAEAAHISAVQNLFTRYNLPIPPNTWIGNVPHYATIAEACAAGAALEQGQVVLYDRLIAVTVHQDILKVYASLQRASGNNHLVAFQRCAQSCQ